MFARYSVEASTNPNDGVVQEYAKDGFGGSRMGPSRTESFPDAFNSQVNGEVESGLNFSGEPGHNASLSSQNHSLPTQVVLDATQQSKLETLIPRGKIGFFLNTTSQNTRRSLHTRISSRAQMPQVRVVFGGTKFTEPDVPIFASPTVSSTFVPGRTSRATSNSLSQYITFAFGDSTHVEIDQLDHTFFQSDIEKSYCINPGTGLDPIECLPSGTPVFCAYRKNPATSVVGAALFFGPYCSHFGANLLGVLKIPFKRGDTSITVALFFKGQ